ncbi:MAG: adenine deaminase [Bacteroidales bacterium]|nr:adenine deaminase [Bacteroidales bacterium]
MKKIEGNLIDIYKDEIYPAIILINEKGIIEEIRKTEKTYNHYIAPPLIDAHVHVESSMLIPSEFAKLAVRCGTVAVVSDPHEIANVNGIKGVNFMIENGKTVPLKFYFTAPSCVPATEFETSGHKINAEDLDKLFATNEMIALGEMMNFPGVINDFKDVIAKLDVAKKWNKPIDGHIPGITGEDLKKYIKAGISTDHEAYMLSEALEKINLGMKILIREGSAAKNFNELASLIDSHNEMCMLCTDDSHPDELIQFGHIDKIIRLGIEKGLSIFNLLRAASINTIKHYKLNVGCLRVGEPADFILIDSPKSFEIKQTYINGECIFDNGRILFTSETPKPINNFVLENNFSEDEIKVIPQKNKKLRIIKCFDGSLLTEEIHETALVENNNVISNTEKDILKIVVINRYNKSKPAIGFIQGFGLKRGAIASSVCHDSHNIIALSTDDTSIIKAINELIENKGGITCVSDKDYFTIPLPYAGLMSAQSGISIAKDYNTLNNIVKSMGCTLTAPFMTLSFMSLLVIPNLKIGDKGLFNITKYDFQDLWV